MSVSTTGARVPAATRAFERLAQDYDALLAGEIFQLLRQRTHDAFAVRFPAGSRVLEIGCGTGIDTAFLTSRGVRVVACDPADAMIRQARQRLASGGLSERATFIPGGLRDLPQHLGTPDASERFDGILSNFGALNCVEHLEPLRDVTSRYLKHGGAALFGVMGRHCAMEALYFTLTGRLAHARRRRACAERRRSADADRSRAASPVVVEVAGIEVPTFYHSVRDIERALGSAYTLERIEGIGVALLPPYLETRWRALPSALRSTAVAIDRVIAHWPVLNRLGDHILLHFVKRRGGYA